VTDCKFFLNTDILPGSVLLCFTCSEWHLQQSLYYRFTNKSAQTNTVRPADSVSEVTTVWHYKFDYYYAPAPMMEALSDDASLTSDDVSVCLSRASGLSREQKGLARLKLAQR